MSDADRVIPILIYKKILVKGQLSVVGDQPGRETMVCGLNIAEAMIDRDDKRVVVSLHTVITSFFAINFPFSEEATIWEHSRKYAPDGRTFLRCES